jgi:hypothetical protein
MRLGRIILAGLAPLVNLSALVPGLAPSILLLKSAHHAAAADSAPSLLQAPLLISAAEHTSVSSSLDYRAPHAIVALFRSSLWLVASLVAVDLLVRRHQRALLRC